MPEPGHTYDATLHAAATRSLDWLHQLPERKVPPRRGADEIKGDALRLLGEDPVPPERVIEELAALAEPGLMAINSGRFFGWVMGGLLPAALGADWLVSSWDQNAGMRTATPAVVGIEEAVGRWLLELFALPPASAVGFATGATTANVAGLAAARNAQLRKADWDVEADGLIGAPPLRVLVGEDSHASLHLALRYLGLGAPEWVAVDDQGRMRSDALAHALAGTEARREGLGAAPIVCLQAGNLHSGAFDPFESAIAVAHDHGAWVHVDGAFGLWAAAAPALAPLVAGMNQADSWATDAHKTLNVPYDCGITVVADASALHASMGVRTSYLLTDGHADPLDVSLEMSRRARGVPVWAAARSLGPDGVAALVQSLVDNARDIAGRLADIEGVEVLNHVDYTQVCLSFGTDERTQAVTAAVLADGTTWMSGSRWRGRSVLRISVSNWSTDGDDIEASVQAVRRAIDLVDGRARG